MSSIVMPPLVLVLFFPLLRPAVAQWFPPVTTALDSEKQLFRPVNFPTMQEDLLAQFSEHLLNKVNVLSGWNFHWTGVTMFREYKSSKSWLIVAGTSPKQSHAGSAFTSAFSAVFGCQLDVQPNNPSGFDISACEILGLDTGSPTSNYSDAGIMGKGLQSLHLPTGGGVVVFCDPLWHSSQGTRSPGGKCNVLERTNTAWRSAGAVEFCSSGGRTEPCAGGFSVDLRLSEDGTNVQLLAGLPIAQPSRRVRAVDNLLTRTQRIIRDIESGEDAFGTSVAWSPHVSGRSDALAIVGSPPTSVQGFRLNSLAEDIDAKVLRMTRTAFGGLGFAVETALAGSSMAIFAGAPFEEVDKVGSNVGRVYVQFKDVEREHNFSLEGSRPSEMFGYAIARIGDVDGDGINDVAISAPALGSENLTGRVYIHRVLANFRLASKPLQILEAPSNLTGFGVAVSRSIDVDADGGPELAVTTLDTKVPVVIYSLPPRLRAKCSFRASPRVTPASIRKGGSFTLKFTINLIDSATDKPFPLPASFKTRSHQVNPDVLWSYRYEYLDRRSNQSDFLTKLLMCTESLNLDPSRPRFKLQEISDVRVIDGGSATLNVRLQAEEDGRFMDLDTVPLHVAYRSILADPQCNHYTRLCPKTAQPLIDWSNCVWKMLPQTYLCPPHPKCSADLQVSVNGSGQSRVPVHLGRREDANQTVAFVLRNNGPTKSEGVRVLLNTIGWPRKPSQPGLRVLINGVEVRDAATGAFLASNERSTGRWSVSLPSNGAAALIIAQQGTVLYPDQELLITADIFLAGLTTTTRYGEEEGESSNDNEEEAVDTRGLPNPGLVANVSTAVGDPNEGNNVAGLTYDVVYKPQLRINAGAALPALVDERKEPPHLTAATKIVLGNEVGPQLEHIFLVENFGSVDLHDLAFQLHIPLRTDVGDHLLYLTDKARLLDQITSDYRWANTLPRMVSANGSEVGVCEIDSELVNPLDLTIREAASAKPSYPGQRTRLRRSADEETGAPTLDRVAFTSPFGDNRVDVYFKRSGQRQTTISCTPADSRPSDPRRFDLDFEVVCARVICRLPRLPRADTVRVSVTGWLWTPTFFKHQIPDVKFVSRLSLLDWGVSPQILLAYPSARLDFPDEPPTYEMPQTVVFRGVTGKYLKRIPLWPIIVGVMLGTILLFSLIAILYGCGFFRRRRRTKEAKRKSMMAAAAARGKPSVYAPDDHSTTRLLDNEVDRKGTSSKGSNKNNHTAKPLSAEKSEQLQSPGPRPSSSSLPGGSAAEQGDRSGRGERSPGGDVQRPGEVAQTDEKKNEGHSSRDPSPSSSSGLPDWLMSEIKENDAKSKKSKASKSDS